MSDEQLFTLANASVMPAWLLLAVAPRWVWTQRLVHSLLYPVLLGAVYTIGFLAAGAFSAVPESEGGMGSLAAISAAFANPRTLLVGWVHYLCFDLFVGAWEARDAQRRGVPHWQLVPCLFLTLMAGPMGLLLYLGFRWMRARSASLGEVA
ncbi:MAG: DUF4281 domain-containing protein [Deltaproteobacteria bacterium]|nr:DUF4281 domain-containing protein [Deltaproteobacteria bacterium]